MNNIELLAPAGSYEALISAVQNGADAVYLAGMAFGARAYAQNFDLETLEKAVDYAHVRGVKIYVTINILIKDCELLELINYITRLYCMGIDAVIVQDLGVVQMIKEFFPGLEIHCSTQMALHNSSGIKVLQRAGVKRIVLARELSIEDIKTINNDTEVELEVFVHGALCYSYSGLCLMSSLIGGRSGNRGRCAQPCRKAYEIIPLNNKDTKKSKAYYISTRDLKTIENIGQIIESGVKSLKIEGRMKKPQYVASIVRAYRKAIDDYLLCKKLLKDEATLKEITQIFNRKFTKGYLLNASPKEFLNPEKPNNRGLFLGKIENYDKRAKTFSIRVLENIHQGDGIEILSKSSDNTGGIINKMYKNNKLIHEAKKGDYVEIQLPSKINMGDEVYKTLDLQLMKELEKTYTGEVENKKNKIFGEVKVKKGQPLKLYLWDRDGNIIYKESEDIVEEAQRVPLQREKLIGNLQKLGNTPFELDDIKVELQPNVALSVSTINKTRRAAIDDLIKLRINKSKRRMKPIDQSKILSRQMDFEIKSNPNKLPKATVKVDGIQQLKEILEFPINRIYYSNLLDLQEAIKLCRIKGVELYYKSPAILKDKELEKLKELLAKNKPDGILAGELGIIDFGRKILQIPVVADISLNPMNSNTIKFLHKNGVDTITFSIELALKDLKALNICHELETETIIYGKLPIMITETCPMINSNKCNSQCDHCAQKPYQYVWGLKDEKKAVFPFTKDNWGRTIIINGHPIYMIDKIKDLHGLPITSFRLDFTNEDSEEIKEIMMAYYYAIEHEYKRDNKIYNINHNKVNKSIVNNFTRGHYYRGVE